jgi:hypothetical protein
VLDGINESSVRPSTPSTLSSWAAQVITDGLFTPNCTRQQLTEFCQRWKVSELALFGSVLRSDFHQGSDLDILVSFAPEAEWSLLDHLRMQEELGELLGRKVDLVSKRAIERSSNWVRRSAILQSAQVIYAA